jgi:hypothetical protein
VLRCSRKTSASSRRRMAFHSVDMRKILVRFSSTLSMGMDPWVSATNDIQRPFSVVGHSSWLLVNMWAWGCTWKRQNYQLSMFSLSRNLRGAKRTSLSLFRQLNRRFHFESMNTSHLCIRVLRHIPIRTDVSLTLDCNAMSFSPRLRLY